MKLRLLAPVLLLSLAGCPPGPGTDAGTDAGAGCTSVADCPMPLNACVTPTCTFGACGTAPVTAGMKVTAQVPGDCLALQCDGLGNVVSVNDATDFDDDGNECTVDACGATGPTHVGAAAGTACGTNGALRCDGQGVCVGCVTGMDCPGADTECRARSCTAGVCGVAFTPAGTATTSQTNGDCKQHQCDGQGAETDVALVTDLPDDSVECTVDTCVGANPTFTPKTIGTACAGGVCDAQAACVACNTAMDCPAQTDFCRVAVCTAGQCGVGNTPANTVLPSQLTGDCRRAVCDGSGAATTAVDDTDLPDDANPCTIDTCANGTPANTPRASGTSCGTNLVCNAMGQCQGCVTGADCPGSDTQCHTRTCTNGTCGVANTNAGTALTQQTLGDCQRAVCDGMGGITSSADDADVPADDSNACTLELCTAGVPSQRPESAGAACTQNGGTRCDGAGVCVQCLEPSHCGAATECAAPTCTAGACGVSNTDAGTALATQTPGNCRRAVCNGSGGITQQNDDADVPVDNLECTLDVCTMGVPSHPAATPGTACTQSGGTVCSNAGTCVQCNAAVDCPGASSECATVTCTTNVCGTSFADVGTVLAMQTPGDCRQVQCNGSGGTTNAVFDADVPADMNQCTSDVCTMGAPSNAPVASGTPCNQSGGVVCSAGACVQCLVGADCASLVCSNNVCQAANCSDLVRNGSESDVDCGGLCANKCAVGKLCGGNGDCSSNVCAGGTCGAPTVTATSPVDGATNVPTAPSAMTVTFSTAVVQATVTAQTSAGACTGSVQVSSDGFATCIGFGAVTFPSANQASLTPLLPLASATTWRLRVTTAVLDLANEPLASTFTMATGFRTLNGPGCSVVISQVYGGGGNTGAPFRNDFIELRNQGTTAVSLSGWSVQYASSTGTSWQATPLTGSIAPGGYYLVQQASGGAAGALMPVADATGSIAMSGTTGKVALVNATTALSGACPTAGVVDLVGFGTANCFETAVAPATSNTLSVMRKGATCSETNNNATDFAAVPPLPRNTTDAATSCSVCGVQNETNAGTEADFCNVQHPPSVTVSAGAVTVALFGRLYEFNVTEAPGAPANVVAQVGFGPDGVDPRVQSGWQFFPAPFFTQVGNDDEFSAMLTAPMVTGTYRYMFRFSLDNGVTWTFGDLDGAGANGGLSFDLAQLPVMTVLP